MTSIVFANGLRVKIAQDDAEAVARRYGDRRPVTLPGARGRRMKVNWEYVASIGTPRSTPPAARRG